MNREKSHPGKRLPSMPVVIPDETLRDAGLTEREALIEIACRLFAAGKLALWPAAKLARENRAAFEQALRERQIAVYCPDELDLADDIAALDRLGI
jgi:predicted HTH domain antitoxin